MSKLSLVCAVLLAASLVMACGEGDEPKPRYNPPGGGSNCGNGNIDGTEQCDGTNNNGATCTSRGLPAGSLSCSSSCTFVTTGCTGGGGSGITGASIMTDPSVCGDGTASGTEWCELGDSGDCSADDLGTGTITCSPACTYDVSGCSITDLCQAWQYYGDGYCDACVEVYNGTTDTADCGQCVSDGVCVDWFDLSVGAYTCELVNGSRDPDCGTCGDGNVFQDTTTGAGEACDGAGSVTVIVACADVGFTSGDVTCNLDCEPDLTGCSL